MHHTVSYHASYHALQIFVSVLILFVISNESNKPWKRECVVNDCTPALAGDELKHVSEVNVELIYYAP